MEVEEGVAGEWRKRVEKLGVKEEDRISLEGLVEEGRRGLGVLEDTSLVEEVVVAAEIEAMAEKGRLKLGEKRELRIE